MYTFVYHHMTCSVYQVCSFLPGGYTPLRALGVPYVRPDSSTASMFGTAAVAGVLMGVVGASDVWATTSASVAAYAQKEVQEGGPEGGVSTEAGTGYIPEWWVARQQYS